MSKLIKIQQLEYKNVAVLLPTLNDIKSFLLHHEEVFDLLLKQEVTIKPIFVVNGSKINQTAVNNHSIVNQSYV